MHALHNIRPIGMKLIYVIDFTKFGLNKILHNANSSLHEGYVWGYGMGKYILKLPPFWISNKELQEQENSIENTNISQILGSITLLSVFTL